MLFTKTRVIGIALAGIMLLGGTTAFAAGSVSLTPVDGVKIADIVSKPGSFVQVEGVTAHIAGGHTGKTEAAK